jgi:hypothetical protein
VVSFKISVVLGLGEFVSSRSKTNSDAEWLCDVLVGEEGVADVEIVVGGRRVLDVAVLLRDEVDVDADCRVRLVTRVVDITIKGEDKKGYILCK